MKLRTKLILSFLLASSSLIIVAISGMQTTHRLSEFGLLMQQDLAELTRPLADLRNLARALSSPETKPTRSETQEMIQRMRAARSSLLDILQRRDHSLQSKKALLGLSEEVINIREQLLLLASDTAKESERRELETQLQKRVGPLVATIDHTIESELRRMSEVAASQANSVQSLSRIHYAIILLCLCFSVFMGIELSRKLSAPIHSIAATATNVSTGDLSSRIDWHSKDELGALVDQLNSMLDSLEQNTVDRASLDHLLQSLPDALFVLDPEGTVVQTNRRAELLLATAKENILGYSITKFLRLENGSLEPQELGSANGQIALLQKAEQEPIPVQLAVSRLGAGQHQAATHICVAQDMREKLRLASERDTYKSQLTKTEQLASIGTMAAIIAHKINQPLTAIKLFVQQCIRENDKNLQSDFLEDKLHDCLSEVDRAIATVQDILKLTRQNQEAPKSPHLLLPIVQRVIATLDDQLREAHLRCSLTGNWNGLAVDAASGEIDGIFFFLLQNALQAASSRGGGELEIAARTADSAIAISFKDTCGGIPTEDLDRIFETFFTTKPIGEGSGLGLPIVKQLVHRLQGTISVETQESVGATFTVVLPLSAQQTASTASENHNAEKNILC